MRKVSYGASEPVDVCLLSDAEEMLQSEDGLKGERVLRRRWW